MSKNQQGKSLTESNNNKTKVNSSSQGIKADKAALVAVSLILLCIAIYLRSFDPVVHKFQKIFTLTRTSSFSANILFHGYADPWAIFVPLVSDIMYRFLRAYLIPSLLFLLSIILAAAAFKKTSSDKNKQNKLSGGHSADENEDAGLPLPDHSSSPHFSLEYFFSRLKDKKIIIILLAVYLTVMILLRFALLDDRMFSGDEFSYLYQAQIMSRFKVYIPAPSPDDPFVSDNIVNNGRLFSKYTIGFPMLLVPFIYLNNPFILNPIMAVLCLIALYYLAKELYDKNTGFLSAFFLGISPFFVMNSITLLVHTPFLFFYIIFILYYIKSIRQNHMLYPIAAGASFGFGMLIRPADAAIPGVVFAAISIFLLIRCIISKNRKSNSMPAAKELAVQFLIMTGAALVFLGILLYVNYLQTDNPFKFAFQEYIESEKWGLGVWGHNHLKAVWNSIFQTTRLFVWLPPVFIFLTFVSLGEKKKENLCLFVLAACIFIFYYFYYGTGFNEFGPRYYYSMLASLPILAARGVIYSENLLRKKGIKTPAALIFTLYLTLFTLIGAFPGITKEALSYPVGLTNVFKEIENTFKDYPEGVVLFLKTTPMQFSQFYVRNNPSLTNKIITAIYLSPEINRQVIEMFPHKKIYEANYDHNTETWSFTPYNLSEELTKEEKIRNRIIAALNYTVALRADEKANWQLQEALKLDPDNLYVLDLTAGLNNSQGNYNEAELYWKRIVEISPLHNIYIYYNLAVLQEKQGRLQEAADNLRLYLSHDKDSRIRRKAEILLKTIEERGIQ